MRSTWTWFLPTRQANEAGWPWEQGYTRLNPGFYDLADLRLAFMIEQGLMPCVVSMWGYYLPFMGVERCKQHWRYLVARYGAYPVVWCVAGETDMTAYSPKWAAAARRYARTPLAARSISSSGM